MGKKLFVGNLPYRTGDDDLQALFGRAGTCESASVATDRATGRSRGFGFVEMASDAEAAAAVEQLNGTEIEGRKITVAPANERPPRR